MVTVAAGETQSNQNMDYNKALEFTSTVRGYHYFRTFWKPEPNQIRNCYYKNSKLLL